MTEQSRSERFAELCAEMATRLNLAPDAERVRHIATLRMMHEVLTIRLVAGHDVDANFANAMLKTAEMLQPLLPSIDPVQQVTLKVIGTCIHCDATFPVEELAPERADRLPRTIDLPAGDPHLPHPAASKPPRSPLPTR